MESRCPSIELDEDQKEYLTSLYKLLGDFQFPCPTDWQWEFINTVFSNLSNHMKNKEENFVDKYLMCGANGTGKTTVVIYTILWVIFWADVTYPDKKVKGVVVSGSADQLYSVVWEDLKNLINNNDKIRHLFVVNDRRLYLKKRPNVWIEPRVANPNNINSLAGVHADITIVLLEEAPVIPNEVLPVVYRFFSHAKNNCMGMLFLTGNPINKGSTFYEIIESEDEKYETWNRFRISRQDIAPEGDLSKDMFSCQIAEMYGEDSDEYRMGVLGLHAHSDSTVFIPEYSIQAALNRPFVQHYGPYTLTIDPAGGRENSDYSAMMYMADNCLLDIFYRKVDPETLLEEALAWEASRTVDRIITDEVGIGMDIAGRLQKRFRGTNVQVIGFRGNQKAYDQWRFPNQNTEVTWKAKEWLELYGKIPENLPYKEILLKQLRSLKSVIDSRGYYTLESKRKMEESPDLADTFRMGFAGGRMATATRVLPLVRKSSYYKPIKKLM